MATTKATTKKKAAPKAKKTTKKPTTKAKPKAKKATPKKATANAKPKVKAKRVIKSAKVKANNTKFSKMQAKAVDLIYQAGTKNAPKPSWKGALMRAYSSNGPLAGSR